MKIFFTVIASLMLFVSIAKAQKEFDGLRGTHNWIGFSDAPNSLYHHIAAQAYDYLKKRSEKIAAINKFSEWQEHQQWAIKTLQEAVGDFPAKTPLNARIVRSFAKDGYRLENIIYESQPGYHVTSSLYTPQRSKKNSKLPAIIYCSGHSDAGYRSKGYQNEIINLVKKGFIVFAFDPMGQGERLEYFDSTSGKSKFRWPSFEHSYAGAQLFITGNTLARNFIWDGIRAIDYLTARKEVDVTRIGITGRSGGGTQSAFIAAFDKRIKACAPENYITNFKRLFQSMGPQDAEQNFLYGIQKGLDMADLLEVRAPMPTLVIATTQDMFPIQGTIETANEVEAIYRAYKIPENFRLVMDDAPHASTKKNREAAYAFFQWALNNPGDSVEIQVDIPDASELQVTTSGQVASSLRGETAFSLNKKDAEKKISELEKNRHKPGYLAALPQIAKKICGYIESKNNSPLFAGRIQRSGYVIEKYLLEGEGNYLIPYIILKPATPTRKVLLYLNPAGKAADVEVNGDMEWFVKQGIAVIAPDLPGMGELGPGEFKGDSYIDSVSYNLWFASMLIGRSIVGIQAGDITRIVNQLKQEGFKDIYGLAKKQLSPVLLHAAVFEQSLSRIALIGPYPSYESIVTNPGYNPNFLYSTVCAAIGKYDLSDLVASLHKRKLLTINASDRKDVLEHYRSWIGD